jgi:hypothetical protein
MPASKRSNAHREWIFTKSDCFALIGLFLSDLSSINSNFGVLFRYLAKSINYKGLAVMFYNRQAFFL